MSLSSRAKQQYTVFFPFKISDWIYPFGINHLFSLAQNIILRIVPKKLNSIYNHKTSSTVSQQDTWTGRSVRDVPNDSL